MTRRWIYQQERSSWSGIKHRCTNPESKCFERYGGRGITMCDRWLNGDGLKTGFYCFLDDMGPRPSSLHSIDRIDNNGNYEPGNCRWSTRIEQQNNKRNTRFVEYAGRPMSVADAVRSAGSVVTGRTAICRLNSGWPMPDAVETPPLFRREPGTRKVIPSPPGAYR